MTKYTLEDCIIEIAKILKVAEKDVAKSLFESFKNISPETDTIILDAMWEFQDDNKSPDLFI